VFVGGLRVAIVVVVGRIVVSAEIMMRQLSGGSFSQLYHLHQWMAPWQAAPIVCCFRSIDGKRAQMSYYVRLVNSK
jgi:hypothetical protein